MEEHLPTYIPTTVKDILLKTFVEGKISEIHQNFYVAPREDTELFEQGNGIYPVPFVNLPATTVKPHQSLVISNSCDTSEENDYSFPPRVTYCAIKPLAGLKDMLEKKVKLDKGKIDGLVANIKSQQVTHMMFLPQGRGVKEDSVALFSFVTSSDSNSTKTVSKPQVVFTLSQTAFWLLLTKLSIHFLRVGEVDSPKLA